MDYRPGGLEFHNSPHQLMAQMADIPGGDYLHRSIDQLRSINERGLSAQIIHDYKQFSDLRNTIAVTDYTIKNNLNNNNNLIDNRNTVPSHNPSPEHHEQKHSHHQQQQQYSSPSTPPTPLSITDAQMNDAKVRTSCRSLTSCGCRIKFSGFKCPKLHETKLHACNEKSKLAQFF